LLEQGDVNLMHTPDQKARPLAEWPGFVAHGGVVLRHPLNRVSSVAARF
jgi:hypothetical protein